MVTIKARVILPLPFAKVGEEVEIVTSRDIWIINPIESPVAPIDWWPSWGDPLTSGFFERTDEPTKKKCTHVIKGDMTKLSSQWNRTCIECGDYVPEVPSSPTADEIDDEISDEYGLESGELLPMVSPRKLSAHLAKMYQEITELKQKMK